MKNILPILLFLLIFLTNGFTGNIFGQGKLKMSMFDPFIPGDCRIMSMASADLNHDGFPDYALVLQSYNESLNGNEARPLLIVMGGPKGKLNLLAKNDSIVLSRDAGGVFGDPFKSISIKDGFLTIEHSVGTNWKWNRTITFTYNPIIKEIVLYKDADISYNISDPNKQTGTLYNKSDYNQLSICQYTVNKTDK